jgi:hypothetical protein
MVILNYLKYDLVSNQREYNMLWVEAEVIFADIPCQKPKYQRTCDILRIHGKSAKFHIRRCYPHDLSFFIMA